MGHGTLFPTLPLTSLPASRRRLGTVTPALYLPRTHALMSQSDCWGQGIRCIPVLGDYANQPLYPVRTQVQDHILLVVLHC